MGTTKNILMVYTIDVILSLQIILVMCVLDCYAHPGALNRFEHIYLVLPSKHGTGRGHNISPTSDVRIWRLQMSDFDV